MRFDPTLTNLQRTMRQVDFCGLTNIDGALPFVTAAILRAHRVGFYRGFLFGWLVTALVAGLLFFIERTR